MTARTRGRRGLATGATLVAPVLAKRLVGNANRLPGAWALAAHRLVADADPAAGA